MEIGPILLEHDRKVKDGLCLASVTVPSGPPPPSGDGEAWRPIGLVIIFLNYSFLLQYFETTRTHQCAPWCYYLETHQKETLYVTVVSECYWFQFLLFYKWNTIKRPVCLSDAQRSFTVKENHLQGYLKHYLWNPPLFANYLISVTQTEVLLDNELTWRPQWRPI